MSAFAQKRPAMPRLTRILIPLVLMAASVLFFFLALELALRALDYPRREARILCLDAIMGNVYCPNLSEHLNNTYDSTLLVTTNREGMADRDYALEKPPGPSTTSVRSTRSRCPPEATASGTLPW